jgi:hypothetical protein
MVSRWGYWLSRPGWRPVSVLTGMSVRLLAARFKCPRGAAISFRIIKSGTAFRTSSVATRAPAGQTRKGGWIMMSRLVIAVALATLVAAPAFAQSHDSSVGSGNIALSTPWFEPESLAARRGLIFVRVHCARCHAVDSVSASPLATARPLRALAQLAQNRACGLGKSIA